MAIMQDHQPRMLRTCAGQRVAAVQGFIFLAKLISLKKAEFLLNTVNKQRFINILSRMCYPTYKGRWRYTDCHDRSEICWVCWHCSSRRGHRLAGSALLPCKENAKGNLFSTRTKVTFKKAAEDETYKRRVISQRRLHVHAVCLSMPFPVVTQLLDCMGLGNILCSKSYLVIPKSENMQNCFFFVWPIYPIWSNYWSWGEGNCVLVQWRKTNHSLDKLTCQRIK